MRVLAIGLGGAGCRIVNSLYATDRRSSKVACVQALAIDVNSDTLAQLGSLPDNAKLFFPPIDPDLHPESNGDTQTATIDIGEIVSRVQNFESGETDAIFVCCGLGGSMVDVAPHIIASLRSTTAEPIFGLITLPCLAEGERRSAKAADDIEMLSPLLDGIILFDNETWYKKTKALRSTLVKKEKGLTEKLGFKKSEPDISPELATYLLLNEAVVKRISLILRAGEFKADGGLDLAEVVLDSGEVLNTMKGMGFITIGYAVERLPHHPLSFLTSWYPTGLFPDAHKIKASRIVDLAKQAIYHEISTPCDITSAHKALILIAGPTHELSMKGFMTVRKWIDRSIAGLETRSGDYPVMNTKNVAIIIMLSGLENIPRITELREIQNQYKSTHQESLSPSQPPDSGIIPLSEGISISGEEVGGSPLRDDKIIKDEMIILPHKAREARDIQDSGKFQTSEEYYTGEPRAQHPSTRSALSDKSFEARISTEKKPIHPLNQTPHASNEMNQPVAAPSDNTKTIESHESSLQRVAPSHGTRSAQPPLYHSILTSAGHGKPPQNKKLISATESKDEKSSPAVSERPGTKGMERQIIERELQRQRNMAISAQKPKTGSQKHPVEPTEIVRIKKEFPKKRLISIEPEHHDTTEISPSHPEKKRVIIQKKKIHSESREPQDQNRENRDIPGREDTSSTIIPSERNSGQSDSERTKIEFRSSSYKTKDHILTGKGVPESSSPQVRDSALMHTNLKSKKNSAEPTDKDSSDGRNPEAIKSPDKKDKNSKKEDLSWI
jgi:tubulin-like protein CetZ